MPIEDKSLRLVRGPEGFLLIHGLGVTPVEMRYVAQGLACAGYTVHVLPSLNSVNSCVSVPGRQHVYGSCVEQHCV
jgi:esterase/lipase